MSSFCFFAASRQPSRVRVIAARATVSGTQLRSCARRRSGGAAGAGDAGLVAAGAGAGAADDDDGGVDPTPVALVPLGVAAADGAAGDAARPATALAGAAAVTDALGNGGGDAGS